MTKFDLSYKDKSQIYGFYRYVKYNIPRDTLFDKTFQDLSNRTANVFSDDAWFDRTFEDFFLQVQKALEPGRKPGLTVVAG